MIFRMAATNFTTLESQLRALLADESDALACATNFVALLFDAIDDVNWLGIYVLRGNELVLGPFQGKPACVRIPVGRGVCGTAAATITTQRVADVHEFPGHIVCDAASRSEVVVPLTVAGSLVGVLDVDSPTTGRFSAADQRGLEKLCRTFCELQTRRNGFI